MGVNDFSHKLCQLNTASDKYLDVKKAREFCLENSSIPRDINNTILDILCEKVIRYEKQIIDLATQLTQNGI